MSAACSNFLSAPAEIQDLIFAKLEKRDLKALRLAASDFHDLATLHLFVQFTFYPYLESFAHLLNVIDTPHIAKHVRTLIYNTAWINVFSTAEMLLDQDWNHIWSESEHPRIAKALNEMAFQSFHVYNTTDNLGQLYYLQRALTELCNVDSIILIDTGFDGIDACQMELPDFYERLMYRNGISLGMKQKENLNNEYEKRSEGSYMHSLFMAMTDSDACSNLKSLEVSLSNLVEVFDRGSLSKYRGLQNNLERLKRLRFSDESFDYFPKRGGLRIMKNLMFVLMAATNLEVLELQFRKIQKRSSRISTADSYSSRRSEVELYSYFNHWNASSQDRGEFSARLTWSTSLKSLSLKGIICRGRELKDILRQTAPSLRELCLGDLQVARLKEDGPYTCLVSIIKWLQENLTLEKISLERHLQNGNNQNWYIDPQASSMNDSCLRAKVHKFILEGGHCPIDHLAIEPGQDDFCVPPWSKRHAFNGDHSFKCSYEDTIDDADDHEYLCELSDHDADITLFD